MKQPMKIWMKVLLIVGTLAILVVLIWVGYNFDVTGFAVAGNPKTQPYQPAKTVWDWLQLLIVPMVLAGAALWFNAQQGKTERKIAQDQEQETTLQSYLDRMADLLLEKHLRESKEGDEIRQVARARTLTVLRRLDTERKNALIRFLFEAQLVGGEHDIIDLSGADLSGTDLRDANLSGANLQFAFLLKAKLIRTNLSRATITARQLKAAESLENAILPDGT